MGPITIKGSGSGALARTFSIPFLQLYLSISLQLNTISFLYNLFKYLPCMKDAYMVHTNALVRQIAVVQVVRQRHAWEFHFKVLPSHPQAASLQIGHSWACSCSLHTKYNGLDMHVL